MKERNNLSFIINMIIVLIILILTLLIIIQVISLNDKKNKIQVNHMDNGIYVNLNKSETINEEIVTPYKSYLFLANYNGFIDNVDFYSAIYSVASTYIPNLYSELKKCDKEEIQKYYLNNKENIERKIGITNIEDFSNLIEGIKHLKGERIIFKSYRFDETTIKSYENTVNANLIIQYENNTEFTINITLLEKIGKSVINVKS